MKFTTPVIGIVALAVAVLTACSSASSNSSGSTSGSTTGAASGSTLTIADVAPFSGPDAALGPTYLASCYGATAAINNAGGVLGHKLDLQERRHPRRPGRRRARGQPDVRLDL